MGAPMQWEASERVAWTEHDGPERPPRGVSPFLGFGVAAILSVVFTAMVLSDDLCPEHRLWVQLLGGAALFGSATAAVALARGWSSAALIAMGTALCGTVIGVIDVAHDATRGWLITAAFGTALLGATWMWLRQLGTRQWQRAQVRQHAAEPIVSSGPDPIAPTPRQTTPHDATAK